MKYKYGDMVTMKSLPQKGVVVFYDAPTDRYKFVTEEGDYCTANAEDLELVIQPSPIILPPFADTVLMFMEWKRDAWKVEVTKLQNIKHLHRNPELLDAEITGINMCIFDLDSAIQAMRKRCVCCGLLVGHQEGCDYEV